MIIEQLNVGYIERSLTLISSASTGYRSPVRTIDSHARPNDYRALGTTNESEDRIGENQVSADDSNDAAEYVTNKRLGDSDGRTEAAGYVGHGQIIGVGPTDDDHNEASSSPADRVADSDIISIILANNRLVAQLHRSIAALADDDEPPKLPNHSNYRHEQRINSKAAQLATRGIDAAASEKTPRRTSYPSNGNRANYHPNSLDALVRETIDFDIDKTLDYSRHRAPYPYPSNSNGRLSNNRPANKPSRYGSELDTDASLSNSSSRLDRALLGGR